MNHANKMGRPDFHVIIGTQTRMNTKKDVEKWHSQRGSPPKKTVGRDTADGREGRRRGSARPNELTGVQGKRRGVAGNFADQRAHLGSGKSRHFGGECECQTCVCWCESRGGIVTSSKWPSSPLS